MGNLRKAVIDTAVITPSGALSPGPLSASAVAAGASLGLLGGLLVALGHLLVELPYFIVLILVMGVIEAKLRRIKTVLDLIAGGFMLFFAYLLVITGIGLYNGEGIAGGSIISNPLTAVATGAVLTGANVYFLAWWFTVGKPIIDSARSMGWRNASIIYIVHYSYDFGWLILLAAIGGLAGLGGSMILAGLMFVLALVLAYYGVKIIVNIRKPA